MSGNAQKSSNVEQAFEGALAHHRAGRFKDAEAGYREILKGTPDHADAMHLLGMLLNQRGEGQQAVELIQRAIAMKPGMAAMHLNLGVVLFGLSRFDEAVASYGNAIAIKPEYPEAHNNLGFALYRLGRTDEAIACYEKALELKPFYAEAFNHLGIALQAQDKLQEAIARYRQSIGLNPNIAQSNSNLAGAFIAIGNLSEAIAFCDLALAIEPANVEANNNMGIALYGQGRVDEAIARYRKALAAEPEHPDTLNNLGAALHAQGRYEEALACYCKVAEKQPGNSSALHMIAAMTGLHSESAPSQYVAGVFDDYADKFDSHLVRELEYQTPELLAKLVSELISKPAGNWEVLDIGCGTGLCGMAMAGSARRLVGVDLSKKMLDKARAKNIYARLECGDLLEVMRGELPASYDVIVAADVFIYIGKIDAVVSEAARLLRVGGLFAFSVEAIEQLAGGQPGANAHSDFMLSHSGRYVQSSAYLERLAASQEFKVRRLLSAPIRKEKGVAVPGWFTVWER
jgi:predicted TPR repeat methyltransferase